jgi:signal transduction histidine kinase
MTRRLLVTYLGITVFALAALAIPLGLTFARRERDRLYFDIERDAAVVASTVEDALEAGTVPEIEAVLDDYRDQTDGRIVVVDLQGVSVADSDDPSGPPRDYSTRPEIAGALDGERVVGTRHSDTIAGDLVYVAIPVASGGTVHGAVRVTFPTAALDARVGETWARLAALSVLVLASVAAVGLLIARSVTRPVRDLEVAAERIAAGDLGARVPVDRGPPELRDLTATFNRTAARLDDLVDAQERFVADAAHQLRTPLTALRLRLENLEAHVPHNQGPQIDAAVDEVHRLSRIVDGLLVLARSDAARAAVHTLEVTRAAADRVDAWRSVAAEENVAIAGRLRGQAWATVPVGLVEQVLDNFIANAVAASPPGTTVVVTVDQVGPWVDLHVIDEGPGLDAEQRELAFDRFWRGTTSASGTGLGLAIVRQLVRGAGGEARLDPGPHGRGLDATARLLAEPRPPRRDTPVSAAAANP